MVDTSNPIDQMAKRAATEYLDQIPGDEDSVLLWEMIARHVRKFLATTRGDLVDSLVETVESAERKVGG